MEIVAATNNMGKLQEMRRLFEGSAYSILSMEEAGLDLEVPETGKSFAENALKKAQAVCEATGFIALGDDSGLCVDALGGAPGILSARFAGNRSTDEENIKKLMQLLERTLYARRTASFVCALALATPSGGLLQVQGSCNGIIGLVSSKAKNGFGYDPIFYYDNACFAEMEAFAKDAVSHRGNAVRKLLLELPAFAAEHMPQN